MTTQIEVYYLLTDAHFLLNGARNYVEINPETSPAHIFELHWRVRAEYDFDYFL